MIKEDGYSRSVGAQGFQKVPVLVQKQAQLIDPELNLGNQGNFLSELPNSGRTNLMIVPQESSMGVTNLLHDLQANVVLRDFQDL